MEDLKAVFGTHDVLPGPGLFVRTSEPEPTRPPFTMSDSSETKGTWWEPENVDVFGSLLKQAAWICYMRTEVKWNISNPNT